MERDPAAIYGGAAAVVSSRGASSLLVIGTERSKASKIDDCVCAARSKIVSPSEANFDGGYW